MKSGKCDPLKSDHDDLHDSDHGLGVLFEDWREGTERHPNERRVTGRFG